MTGIEYLLFVVFCFYVVFVLAGLLIIVKVIKK
jgi:hypothetical protein